MRLRFLFGLRKRRFHVSHNLAKWGVVDKTSSVIWPHEAEQARARLALELRTKSNKFVPKKTSKTRSKTSKKALGRNRNAEKTIEQIQAGGMELQTLILSGFLLFQVENLVVLRQM